MRSVVPPKLRLQVGTFLRFNVQACQRHFVAITGCPVADYSIHQRSLPLKILGKTGEFGLCAPDGRWRWASTSLSQLADGMTYYSCHDFCKRAGSKPAPTFGGPRGIRTLDLLNAIETRSQLRYGP